jgi:hypothetical protein
VQLLRPQLAHDAEAVERFWQRARAVARETAAAGDRVLDAGTDSESGQAFVVREWPASPSASRRKALVPRELGLLPGLPGRLEADPRWLALGGLAVALVVIGAGIKPGVERWLAWVNESSIQAGRGLSLVPATAAPADRAQPSSSNSTPVPTRAPTATATPVSAGQTRRIVNTDGRGVALRRSPGGDRMPGKGYDEGATVQAFEQSGQWTRIRGSDGREGWVLSVTLAP